MIVKQTNRSAVGDEIPCGEGQRDGNQSMEDQLAFVPGEGGEQTTFGIEESGHRCSWIEDARLTAEVGEVERNGGVVSCLEWGRQGGEQFVGPD